jgi:hypothetical protein
MNLRPTLAVGYDAVIAIDPESYAVTEDAAGRAYAFDMDTARDAVEDLVRSAFGPSDLDAVEVTPGYVRVRVRADPRDAVAPKAILETLRSTADEYTARHATDADLDGLAFDTREYIGTYRPDDAPEQGPFLDAHAPTDVSPESDGPVFAYTREDADDAARADRQFRYRVVLPFDGSIYEQTTALGVDGTPPVRWDPEPVQDVLRSTVGNLPPWPGRPKNTPLVEIHPTHAVVEHVTATLRDGPEDLAERIGRAFLYYNRFRNVDDEHSTRNESQLHPPIKFDGRAFVRAGDTARDADDWIAEHALDAVDGSPRTEDAGDDTEDDADTGRSLNPFR